MTVSKFILTDTLAADGSSGDEDSYIINFPKMLSSINRTQYHNVDLQGNAQMYTVAVKTFGTKMRTFGFAAADNYVTKRSVKAWHDARAEMFKRAGFRLRDLGPYARTLRPYLNVAHQGGTIPELDQAISSNSVSTGDGATAVLTPGFKGAEWTYSQAAVATPQEEGHTTDVQERDLIDGYFFTLLDDSVVESSVSESSTGSEANSFVSVGMISEWLDSFKKQSKSRTVDADNAIDSDNALIQLMSQQGADREEVLEIVADIDAEARPWDKTGAQYSNALTIMSDTAVNGESSTSILRLPCGLLQFGYDNLHSAQDVAFTQFEVLSIEDM